MSILFNQLTSDMKEAMKAKEKAKLSTIRMAISAVKQKTIDEKVEINDEIVTAIIIKMIKQRQDSYNQYISAERQELADVEKFEIDVLMKYMPKQLTDDEIIVIVKNTIQATNANSMKDMGKVMALVKSKVAGKADMGKISNIVKSQLL